MKCISMVTPGVLGAALAALTWTTPSLADDTSAGDPSSLTAGASEQSGDSPDHALIGAGIFILASAYMPAAAVAGSSDLRADQRLYIPVAGPWLDLAQRPMCAATGCGAESTYRALVATDGILQGLGAFMTLVGLLSGDDSPPPATASADGRDTVHVSPAQIGAGAYGLTAYGSF